MSPLNLVEHKSLGLWDKLNMSHQALQSCDLCEHHCATNRFEKKSGKCGAGDTVYLYSEFLHYGIEYDLIPSYAIFFSGCSLRCVFCSSLDGLRPNHGVPLDPTLVASHIDKAAHEGAKSVLFVGGEPSIHPHGIIQIAMNRSSQIPFVLDTNLYMTESVFDLLEGVVQIYLADFKFGNNQCAQRIAGIPRYMEILTRNLLLSQSFAELYIRHILLPGHLDCCFKPIVRWVSEFMPHTKFHLVESYEPAYLWQKQDDLNRKISPDELNKTKQFALSHHLKLMDT